jgi:hypothetical protein
MKYKLKDINLDFIEYKLIQSNSINNNCKLINFTYSGEELEFQSPKVIIEKIVRENNKEFLILKILGNEACKCFCLKLFDLEKNINYKLNKNWFNENIPINDVKSVFKGDCFTVKIPFKYSKPIITTYSHNGNVFNYYNLKEGMEIICLLSINNIWINFDNSVNYYLNVKEIKITKDI